MQKLKPLVAGVSLAAAAMFGLTGGASAAWHNNAPHGPPPPHYDQSREAQFFQGWCASHKMDPDCRDFSHNHGHWDNARYHAWFARHQHDHGFDPGAAAAFGFGAAIAGAIAHAH
jgi:hypothetical protein